MMKYMMDLFSMGLCYLMAPRYYLRCRHFSRRCHTIIFSITYFYYFYCRQNNNTAIGQAGGQNGHLIDLVTEWALMRLDMKMQMHEESEWARYVVVMDMENIDRLKEKMKRTVA